MIYPRHPRTCTVVTLDGTLHVVTVHTVTALEAERAASEQVRQATGRGIAQTFLGRGYVERARPTTDSWELTMQLFVIEATEPSPELGGLRLRATYRNAEERAALMHQVERAEIGESRHRQEERLAALTYCPHWTAYEHQNGRRSALVNPFQISAESKRDVAAFLFGVEAPTAQQHANVVSMLPQRAVDGRDYTVVGVICADGGLQRWADTVVVSSPDHAEQAARDECESELLVAAVIEGAHACADVGKVYAD